MNDDLRTQATNILAALDGQVMTPKLLESLSSVLLKLVDKVENNEYYVLWQKLTKSITCMDITQRVSTLTNELHITVLANDQHLVNKLVVDRNNYYRKPSKPTYNF